MPHSKRVAFVSTLSISYVHRLYRGALSRVDGRGHLVMRDFPLMRDFAERSGRERGLERLRDWNPDGILSYQENDDLELMLQTLNRPCPVVCMNPVKQRQGVAVVAGSFATVVKTALQHFRQIGIRHPAFLSLENDSHLGVPLTKQFVELTKPPNPDQAIFVKVVDPALLDDPGASVTPVPVKLSKWLKGLPKPCGIFCPEAGGGGYVIRVCRALGLRVPEDVAVVGGDDADLSLAVRPTLTSLTPVGEKIGQEAMRLLERMMAGEPEPRERIRIDAMDLHVRQSTGGLQAPVCDIAKALEYIQLHACNGLSVTRLLKDTQQVSNKTFHNHFKAATGQSPGEAIQARQIEEAKRMLALTELSVTLVAEKSGYGSSSDFARRFRRLVGISPSDYRKRSKKGSR